MAEPGKQKLKLLYLQQILMDETDENCGVTMAEIIDRLADRGLVVERKSVYRDIKALNDFGIQVDKLGKSPEQYAIRNRNLSLQQVMLLIDAVQSSKYLSDNTCNQLVDGLKNLVSKRQRSQLRKSVHVLGRPKNQRSSEYADVDKIQQAISNKCKISFHYYKRGLDGEPKEKSQDKLYVETPLHLVYCDGTYYVITYNEKHDKILHYRLDRMSRLLVKEGDEASYNSVVASYELPDLESHVFGMHTTEKPMSVVLRIDESAMSSVCDRFGKGMSLVPHQEEGYSEMMVQLIPSTAFFGWLSQFGSAVSIVSPESLKHQYVEHLKGIVSTYK